MRNIKFRAKDVAGNWLFENLQQSNIQKSTLCEFTGFFDSTGKEIFENDILEKDCQCHKLYKRGKVIMENGAWQILYPDNGFSSLYWSLYHYSFKIVGNSFDNPELAEVKQC